MSPAPKTRGRLVRMAWSTTIRRWSSSRPHSAIGPMLATKPSAATTVWAGSVVTSPVSRCRTSTSAIAPSPRMADSSQRRMQRHAEVADLLDHPGVRPELLPPVHQMHRPGDRVQRPRPVEGGVAAAHDHHVAAGVVVEPGDEVDQPAALPAFAAAGSAGSRRGVKDPMPPVMRAALDSTVAPRSVVTITGPSAEVSSVTACSPRTYVGSNGLRLLDEVLDQHPALDGREAGDVEDVLLRVHRGHLAARARAGCPSPTDDQPRKPA